MTHRPKISVIIPSFNKAKYILETLDSIFLQTYRNFEVVVQDGGSSDGTLKILNDYSGRHPSNMKVESKNDDGQLDAINEGFAKAKGDIMTFINADDIYLSDSVFGEVVKKYSEDTKALWFAGMGKVIDNDGEENKSAIYRYFVKNFKNILLKINYYPCLLMVNYLIQPSVFITHNAFEKYGPFGGTKDFVLEYDLWLKLGRKRMPKIIDSQMSGFRISEGSITTTNYIGLLDEDLKVVKRYTKNPLLIFIHFLGNLGRRFVIKAI